MVGLSQSDFAKDLDRRWSEASVVAITGAGGLGKSTVATLMAESNWVHVPIDAFIVDRSIRRARGLSGYDPRAFRIADLIDAVTSFVDGGTVRIPAYDHATGTSCSRPSCSKHRHELPASANAPRRVVIEGAFMWLPELRERIESACFVSASAPGYWDWRARVDVERRGYPDTSHIAQLKSDFDRYIAPSVRYCELLASVALPSFTYRFDTRE